MKSTSPPASPRCETEFVEMINRQIQWMITFAAGWNNLLVTLVWVIP